LDRHFAEYAQFLFKFIKEEAQMPNKDRLGDPGFPLAKEAPQLQAADYLAYLAYLHGQERMQTEDWLRVPMRPLNAILQRIRSREDCVLFNAECLRGMLQKIPIPNRTA
jgi:hypothetical protein